MSHSQNPFDIHVSSSARGEHWLLAPRRVGAAAAWNTHPDTATAHSKRAGAMVEARR